MVQKLVGTKKVIKVEKISEKYDISTLEEKQISLIGKKKKGSREITPGQIELVARWLKASKMFIKKRIKK